MDYEIVELQEKVTVGITARTNNMSPDMGMIIGGLWGKFYEGGIYGQIKDKSSDKSLGIYSDYEDNEMGDYNITVACQVESTEKLPEGTVIKVIPAGRYARFVVKGRMQSAVAEFWQKLWKMELDRAFTSDFEEYQNDDPQNTEVHIYIALKQPS